MNVFHFAYNFLASGLALILLPVIWCHEKKTPERRAALAQRLGYSGRHPSSGRHRHPKIWIHAVSVGEVKAAEAIVHALDDTLLKGSLLLTTTTMTGQRYARRQFKGRATVQYAPLDLWWVTARFLATHRPDLLVCMETEIWPNWIAKVHAMGIRTVFLNGRISTRSIRSYLKIRALLKPALEKVDAFSMISEADARRIIQLGAPTRRVLINGNVKMDVQACDKDAAVIEDLKRLYTLENDTPVFIAGSIRGAEADILMDVYIRLAAQIPDLVFIIAPRHIERASRILEMACTRGIRCQYRTEMKKKTGARRAPVVILNTIGELRTVYGIASVVFCGGSLVPLGGQNVLEAAMWAKPVLYGPSMEDFQEARNLLESFGGGACVADSSALADQAGHLLTNPSEARRMGLLARRAVLSNQGAAHRHARVVNEILRKM